MRWIEQTPPLFCVVRILEATRDGKNDAVGGASIYSNADRWSLMPTIPSTCQCRFWRWRNHGCRRVNGSDDHGDRNRRRRRWPRRRRRRHATRPRTILVTRDTLALISRDSRLCFFSLSLSLSLSLSVVPSRINDDAGSSSVFGKNKKEKRKNGHDRS